MEYEPAAVEEFKALAAQSDWIAENLSLTGGAALADAPEEGARLVFNTTDLEGNPVPVGN